jgi:hypothetical protein
MKFTNFIEARSNSEKWFSTDKICQFCRKRRSSEKPEGVDTNQSPEGVFCRENLLIFSGKEQQRKGEGIHSQMNTATRH